MRKRLMRLLGVMVTLSMIVSALVYTVPAHAATYADVTVTATPAYIAIANAGGNWTMNVTGDSTIDTNTTYYANPLGNTTPPSATVVDGECMWTLTDTSTVVVDITVTMANFAGGDANMTNSDAGTNGATSYGAKSYRSGQLLANAVIIKTAASDDFYNGSGAGDADFKWGIWVLTQTDAWTGGSSSTSTLTITATKQ